MFWANGRFGLEAAGRTAVAATAGLRAVGGQFAKGSWTGVPLVFQVLTPRPDLQMLKVDAAPVIAAMADGFLLMHVKGALERIPHP